MEDILIGAVDRSIFVFVPDPASTDGSGKTGLVAANLTVSYARMETDNDAIVTDVTSSLSDLAALTTAHTDWGLKEVSSTLAPGLYRLDPADAVFASGAWTAVVYVMITTSAAAAVPKAFNLVSYNALDGVRLGLTALPNAAAEAAGGLYTRGTGAGQINQDSNGRVDARAAAISNDAITAASIATGAIDADAIADNAIDAGAFAADAITAAKLHADVTTELQSGLATAAALATVDGIVDDILLDTAEIGAAGAGLTNINLPNQTMDIVGNMTGNLSGTVGSVTGAVGSVASGGITAASFGAGAIDAAAIAANAIGASELAADAVAEIADAVWDEATSGHVTAGTFGQESYVIRANTAQAGGATTITLDASASATDDIYNYDLIVLTGGTGAGQARYITDYVGSTKVATVASWQTNPSSDSVFLILPGGQIPGATAPTAGEVADAVWDEATLGHTTSGTFGEQVKTDIDDILADTVVIGTPAGASVSADIAAIEAQTDDIGVAGAGLTAVPWNAAWDAEVQSEVQDAVEVNHLDHLLAVDYDPASKPGVATALLNELVESDAGVSRYTANALEQAPTGGSAPTAADIADAVWDEATAGHTTSGTFGEQAKTDIDAILADTNELQTDWVNGGRLDLILDARASQTSVDDLPTNAELATALAAADDAVLAAIAALNNLSQANIRTAVGLASANLDTQLGDVPTNAELATALGTADDAVLAAIAALNNLSAAQVNAQVLDVLVTDTFAEPGAVPAATASLKDKVGWLAALARNKITQTSTTQTLRNDADSGNVATAAVSDDSTTFTRAEWT